MQSWREVDAITYLRFYARIIGRDAAAFENTQRRLAKGMEKEFFEENNAKLDATLRQSLGSAIAAPPFDSDADDSDEAGT